MISCESGTVYAGRFFYLQDLDDRSAFLYPEGGKFLTQNLFPLEHYSLMAGRVASSTLFVVVKVCFFQIREWW